MGMNEHFEKDAFSKHCGVRLIEASDGRAVAQMTVGPEHLNHVGTVHGGAIFALADAAFAAASNSHGFVAVAININISYLKAATAGILTATARQNPAGRKIGSYEINITDSDGQLIAVFHGLTYNKV